MYEKLEEEAGFWDSLSFENWFDILFCSESVLPKGLEERALEAIVEKAETFDHFRKIAFCFEKRKDLKKWAVQKMEEKAVTFQEIRTLGTTTCHYNFDKLLQAANCVGNLVEFCNSALEKMSGIVVIDCRDWIFAYRLARPEKVKKFILQRITASKLPAENWVSLMRDVHDKPLAYVVLGQMLISIKSFAECMGAYHAFAVREGKEKIVERARELAETFEEWQWISDREKSNSDGLRDSYQKMAELAKTFDQWNIIYRKTLSKPNSPLYQLCQLAFEKMKELAIA